MVYATRESPSRIRQRASSPEKLTEPGGRGSSCSPSTAATILLWTVSGSLCSAFSADGLKITSYRAMLFHPQASLNLLQRNTAFFLEGLFRGPDVGLVFHFLQKRQVLDRNER